ncbi:hypothetical protein BDL97_03G042100 [Sphagnum fallax]|nr:hypothetical protein BDL97_03G042100 [Sphagnum fallax]
MQESKDLLHNNCYLTVHHVLWSSTELLIAFDHLVHYLQEVPLSDSFLMGSNCIHASLHAYTANISTIHGPCVDLQDLGPTFKVRQPKVNLPVQPSWLKKCWVQHIQPAHITQ